MEQFLDRLNKLSTSVRVGIIVGTVLAITAGLVYFVFMPLEEQIKAQTTELAKLEQEKLGKQQIADNLNERRKEMNELEQKFQEALTQLPEKKDIDELLAQLNDIGKKSGLEVARVVPGAEAQENTFIARIPIQMQVAGNYHEIGLFLQEISSLRRIVNVNNIKLSKPELRGDKIVLGSEFLATTFRFSEQKAPAKGKAKP